jgi:hypothetical protein
MSAVPPIAHEFALQQDLYGPIVALQMRSLIRYLMDLRELDLGHPQWCEG